MKMKSVAILSFVMSIGTLLAQASPLPSGSRWGTPNLDALKSFLLLSDQQVQDLTALQATFRDTVKPIYQQIMTDQKQLKQEMGKASPDSSVMAQLLADIKNLRSQIKSKRDGLQPQMLALLSDSQKGQLANLQQALSLQQAAHQATALGLVEAPQQNSSRADGSSRPWRGMHPRIMGQP